MVMGNWDGFIRLAGGAKLKPVDVSTDGKQSILSFVYYGPESQKCPNESKWYFHADGNYYNQKEV